MYDPQERFGYDPQGAFQIPAGLLHPRYASCGCNAPNSTTLSSLPYHTPENTLWDTPQSFGNCGSWSWRYPYPVTGL